MKIVPSLLIAGLATYASAADVDLSKLPPPSSQKDVTYAKDIKPILEGTCFRCHGERERKGRLRLDSLDAVMAGGKDGKVVVPGDSEKSKIVIAVAQLDPKTAMPPKPRNRRGPRGERGPGREGFEGPNAGRGAQAGEERPRPGSPAMDEDEHAPEMERGTNAPPGAPGRRSFGPPPKPLTPEQVGLIRAWIDQGAK